MAYYSSYFYYTGIPRRIHSIVVNDLNAFVGKTMTEHDWKRNSMVPFSTAGTLVEASRPERVAECSQQLFTCSKCIIITVMFDGCCCTLSSAQVVYTTIRIHNDDSGLVWHRKQSREWYAHEKPVYWKYWIKRCIRIFFIAFKIVGKLSDFSIACFSSWEINYETKIKERT